VHIRLFDTRDDVASAAAQRIADALRSKPDLILGLPAGQTPVPVYAELRRLHASGHLDFSRATCFTIDEFVGLDRRHRGSFHAFVSEHLFSTVNVDPARVHSLDGAAVDVERECERYEAAIAAAGGIDLQMLGLGSNGHVGFNEPARPWSHAPIALRFSTRRVETTPGTLEATCIRCRAKHSRWEWGRS
jgi:glucosamine-6-phosphate deaminase